MDTQSTPTAHATWRYNGVHIWGWQRSGPAPAGWLLSGFGGRGRSPLAAGGDLTRIQLQRDDGVSTIVSSVRLSPPAAMMWLGRHLPGGSLPPSDSLVWFGHLGVFAARLIEAGRLVPQIGHEHGHSVARWVPIIDGELQQPVVELAEAAPPICFEGEPVAATSAILERFVDALARHQLDTSGWAPEANRRRDPRQRALRSVAAALVGDATIKHPANDRERELFEAELDHAATTLHRAVVRASGQPVVVPRLRLDVPSDPHDEWAIELQLADEIDPGRWCTADDLWNSSPLALDLAGDPRHLDTLRAAATDAAQLLAEHLPELSSWRLDSQPDRITIDIDAVETFLDERPAVLDELRIGLIGPEQLIRGGVRVHGVARTDHDPTSAPGGRFGREALVNWSLAVTDGSNSSVVDDAQLARLEATGAGLLHIGHRWVRIDAEAIQRAKQRLTTHRETQRSLGAAALLQLAAEASAAEASLNDNGDGPDPHAAPGNDDGALDTVGVELDVDEGWALELLTGLDDDRLSETPEPATFKGTLRHYQRRGLSWLQFLADVGLGGCLADDMGLGKTATTLAHLATREGPHLVVCPLSVMRNWQLEAERFTPSMSSVMHHGSGRSRGDSLFRLDEFDLVITTYGLLGRDIETLSDIRWTTVVLDEAQAIKNQNTRSARAVRALPARQRLALTGTPIENRLTELWAILDAVNPGMLGSAQGFRQRFAGPIERQHDPVATTQLRTLTDPVLLRRTKRDKRLLPDLPDKIEQIAWARLTREQAALYKQVVDQLLTDADEHEGMQRRGIVLAALTRLKQICNHPAHALADGSRLDDRSGKLTRFDELIHQARQRDEQVLVFTQFREMGALLERHLRDRSGLVAPFLHGGVSRTGRERMIDRFQAGDHPVLLVSLKAGGTGLNLTAASQVIHYDRWWNPAVEDQATDRSWRMGQSRTVMVHKLVTEGTVEERIATVIDEKRELADAVVGSGEAWMSELSTNELRTLVELDPGAGE